MSSWNYRVIFHPDPEWSWFGLHEVHYNKKGKVTGWTQNPITFTCDADEGAAGIRLSLAMAIADAIRLPVLKEVNDKLVEFEND